MKFKQVAGFLFIALCLSTTVFANNVPYGSGDFDFQQNSNYLNEVDQQLSQGINVVEKNTYKQLFHIQHSIKASLAQAQACVTYTREQVKAVQPLLQNSSSKQDPVRYQYLSTINVGMEKKNFECSTYVFMAQRTLNSISERLIQYNKNYIFEKTPIFPRLFNWQQLFQFKYNNEILYQSSSSIILLSGCALLGYLFILIIAKYLLITYRKSSHVLLTKRLAILPAQLCAIFAISVTVYSRLTLVTTDHSPMAQPLLWGVVAYSLVVIRLYAGFIKHANDTIATSLFNCITVITTILLLGYIGTLLLTGQVILSELITFGHILWVTLLNLFLFWINLLVLRMNFFQKKLSVHVLDITKIIVALVYGSAIAAGWCGYLYLAQFLVVTLVASLTFIIIAWEASCYLGNVLFSLFYDPSSKLANKIHAIFGLAPHQKMIEISIIRWIINIPILLFTGFLLASMWGVTQYSLDAKIHTMQYGFHVAGISINTTIFYALTLFCVISLLGRALAMSLSSGKAFSGDVHRQQSIRLLVTYITFSVALILSLIRMDVDFSKIALIAGALSVGLGFGLKDLVGDLVSGITLLITKPIKIGDHVMIDATEGFIKEIGLFSTRLITLSQSVAIFPNSLLRNHQLINYTFQDKSGRITIQVLLDKEGDLEFAKQLLLNIALKNKHVIQTKLQSPTVLFDKILVNGTLSYLLDLAFFIKDVDIKDLVLSDLNLEIVNAFKENNLDIRLTPSK